MLAPAKTPDDVCAKLNAAINAVVDSPALNTRLRALGYEPSTMPLAETQPYLNDSIAVWRKMILATGPVAPE